MRNYKPGWWFKNTPDKYSKIGSSPTKFGGDYFLCRRHGVLSCIFALVGRTIKEEISMKD